MKFDLTNTQKDQQNHKVGISKKNYILFKTLRNFKKIKKQIFNIYKQQKYLLQKKKWQLYSLYIKNRMIKFNLNQVSNLYQYLFIYFLKKSQRYFENTQKKT